MKKVRPFARMTLPAFLNWFRWHGGAVLVTGPNVHLVPCTCRDINCRGWRFVAGTGA